MGLVRRSTLILKSTANLFLVTLGMRHISATNPARFLPKKYDPGSESSRPGSEGNHGTRYVWLCLGGGQCYADSCVCFIMFRFATNAIRLVPRLHGICGISIAAAVTMPLIKRVFVFMGQSLVSECVLFLLLIVEDAGSIRPVFGNWRENPKKCAAVPPDLCRMCRNWPSC